MVVFSIEATFKHISPAAVFVPTHSGATARSIARFRLPVWIVAISRSELTCQQLQFSSGVLPTHETDPPNDWKEYVRSWLHEHEVKGDLVILAQGPSRSNPSTNHRMEIIDLRSEQADGS